MSDAPTLDQRVLDELRAELGDASARKLVGIFANRAPQLGELVRACLRRDPDELARNAHSVRGGAAMIGAARLAELAAEIERLAGARRFDEAEPLANEAATEFRAAVAELRATLRVPTSGTGLPAEAARR